MPKWDFASVNAEPKMILWRNAARTRLPDYDCVDSLETKEKLFDFGNQLGVLAAMSILTEDVAELRKPHDWWQAFKERWFPSRALKLWPVEYDYVDIKALYPEATFKDETIIWKAKKRK